MNADQAQHHYASAENTAVYTEGESIDNYLYKDVYTQSLEEGINICPAESNTKGLNEPDRVSLCGQAAFQALKTQSYLLYFKFLK